MSPDRRALAAVSAAQLALNLTGLVLAVRRRLPYDFLFLHGRPDHVARDAASIGTALSAPVPILLAQAWGVGTLLRRPSEAAARTLGGLGAVMVGGYLGERLVRRRLFTADRDPAETPVAAAALGLSAAMAVLGLRRRRQSGAAAPAR